MDEELLLGAVNTKGLRAFVLGINAETGARHHVGKMQARGGEPANIVINDQIGPTDGLRRNCCVAGTPCRSIFMTALRHP